MFRKRKWFDLFVWQLSFGINSVMWALQVLALRVALVALLAYKDTSFDISQIDCPHLLLSYHPRRSHAIATQNVKITVDDVDTNFNYGSIITIFSYGSQ